MQYADSYTECELYVSEVITSLESDSSKDLSSDDEDMSSTTSRPLDERLVGVVIGGTVVAILLLLGVVVFCVVRRRYGRKKYLACSVGVRTADMCRVPSGLHPAMAADMAAGTRQLPTAVVGNGKLLSNGIMYNSVGTCDDAEVSFITCCNSVVYLNLRFLIYFAISEYFIFLPNF